MLPDIPYERIYRGADKTTVYVMDIHRHEYPSIIQMNDDFVHLPFWNDLKVGDLVKLGEYRGTGTYYWNGTFLGLFRGDYGYFMPSDAFSIEASYFNVPENPASYIIIPSLYVITKDGKSIPKPKDGTKMVYAMFISPDMDEDHYIEGPVKINGRRYDSHIIYMIEDELLYEEEMDPEESKRFLEQDHSPTVMSINIINSKEQ